jgi:hypothetical protein
MLVSTVVRRDPRSLVLALFALTACSESATGPTPPASRTPEPSALLSSSNSGSGRKRGGSKPQKVKAHETYDADSKNVIYTFTIDPRRSQSVKLGDHTVVLPAHVICDPSTSSYGAGEWEKPCALATAPIEFRAIAGTRQGHAAIAFEPDVRFAPGVDAQPSRWVILTLRDTKKVKDKDQKDYAILWWDADAEANSGEGSSNEKGAWVDESETDPTLRAWTDPRGNLVTRRLKHFSGYNVTSGRSGRNR